MKSKGLFFSGLMTLALVASPAFAQQVVEWNYNGNASAVGSGCDNFDTMFIEAGNQISVIFSSLGVELTGTWDDSKAAKKTCTVVVPAKVKKGWYIGRLKQTVFYGYSRSNNTTGRVSAVSRFFNQFAGQILAPVPTPGYDANNEPFIEKSTERYFGVMDPTWCSTPTDYEGNFMSILTVLGQRRYPSDDIVVQIDGQDIRFDAMGYPMLCP